MLNTKNIKTIVTSYQQIKIIKERSLAYWNCLVNQRWAHEWIGVSREKNIKCKIWPDGNKNKVPRAITNFHLNWNSKFETEMWKTRTEAVFFDRLFII